MSEEVKTLPKPIVEEPVYMVPESHLFRLLAICSNRNKCKEFGSANCQCSNENFVPKRPNRKTRRSKLKENVDS
jgi:hypothetical protein